MKNMQKLKPKTEMPKQKCKHTETPNVEFKNEMTKLKSKVNIVFQE